MYFCKQTWRNIAILLVSMLSIWHFYSCEEAKQTNKICISIYLSCVVFFHAAPRVFFFFFLKTFDQTKVELSQLLCAALRLAGKKTKNGNNSIPIRHRPCCVASRWRREDGGKNKRRPHPSQDWRKNSLQLFKKTFSSRHNWPKGWNRTGFRTSYTYCCDIILILLPLFLSSETDPGPPH